PVHTDFGVDAGLGLQIRVADKGRGALAAEAGDAVVEVSGVRCLVTGAHTTLDRPAVTDGIHTVQTRADVAVENVVGVIPYACRESQRGNRRPVVLQEHGTHLVILYLPGGNARLHAEDAIFQLTIDDLKARYNVVTAHRAFEGNIQFGIQGVLAAAHVTARTGQEGRFHDVLALLYAQPCKVASPLE